MTCVVWKRGNRVFELRLGPFSVAPLDWDMFIPSYSELELFNFDINSETQELLSEFRSSVAKRDEHVFLSCTCMDLYHGFLYPLENCFISLCMPQFSFLYWRQYLLHNVEHLNEIPCVECLA